MTLSSAAQFYILLSDPSWEALGGFGPYSAGFIVRGSPLGSLQSVFGAATPAFTAAAPTTSFFYEYLDSFTFTGNPFVVPGYDLIGGGALSIFPNSISNATASLVVVPEPSSWAMMLVGLSAIAYARHRRRPFGRNSCCAIPFGGSSVLPWADKSIVETQKSC